MTSRRETVTLGAIADIQLGKMLSPKNVRGGKLFPYLRNQNVQWDRVDLSDLAQMHFNEAEQEKFSLKSGDLLVCEGGEPGRAAIWRGEIQNCYYQKALHRIRPKNGVAPEYLLFALWHLSNQGELADMNSQTTIAHLPLVRLKGVRIPLLSTQEQAALVSTVRASLLEAAKASAAAREQVSAADERLVSSILEEIFGVKPVGIDASRRHEREGWHWNRLQSLARLESGHTPSRRHPEWWGGEVPWLALPDIRKLHGKVAMQTTENTNGLGLANSSARLLPVNTVCLCRDASIGYVTILGRPMATSQHFFNWICDPGKLDAEFLMYAFMASHDYLRELGSGSVLKTIYMPTIESFHICAPALPEQRRIARRLRERLAEAETLQIKLKERLAEIERLPQRILAAAFGSTQSKSDSVRAELVEARPEPAQVARPSTVRHAHGSGRSDFKSAPT